jgi:mono/diheme cytochrome c family protein
MLFAAQGVPRTVGVLLAATATIAWLLYIAFNARKSRAEVGSEVELAPNRKLYYSDEELETKKLDRSLLAGVVLLGIVGVGLPLYWLAEPARMDGAIVNFNKKFAGWGAADYASTADGGFNCAGCHGAGGVGGVAPYTFNDPLTGQTKTVNWKAPALNTIFYKYREAEVETILVYGRPFSPMAAWGLEGGGPMNEQQITNIIEYLKSVQIPLEDAQTGVARGVIEYFGIDTDAAEFDGLGPQQIVDAYLAANPDAATRYGEALFNNPASAGSYNCARCHTKGWSYDEPAQAGSGAYGPSLVGGVTPNHFPNADDQIAFVTQPPGVGKRYGIQNQQFKPMPGFGQVLTEDQVRAIVEYERGL